MHRKCDTLQSPRFRGLASQQPSLPRGEAPLATLARLRWRASARGRLLSVVTKVSNYSLGGEIEVFLALEV